MGKEVFMAEKKIVRYEDFGAVGDGKTCDFAAMKAAHDYANENGCTVAAEPGKNYYISSFSGKDSIIIKTDTVWDGAVITSDDSGILPTADERLASLFVIASDYEHERLEADSDFVKAINAAGGIRTDDKKLPMGLGYKAMIIPYDVTHKIYIRYGANHNSGQDQHEVMVIEADGTIDPNTPALLDYKNITYVIAIRVDDEPITISGGTVVTVANQAPCAYTYYARNISVRRSNVVVRGVVHKRVGEIDHGAPYSGFIGPNHANNLLVEGCVFQAHRFYYDEVAQKTPMGTYELGGYNSNGLYYKNCTQSNYFDKDGVASTVWFDENGNTGLNNHGDIARVWGVMGTNYCKNITYDNCTLNRLDAHAGVYNASIINGSNVKIVSLIGGGTATFKDSTIHSANLMSLRSDYGSTWNGEFIFDNVTWVTESEAPFLITGAWVPHNFGYTTYLPTKITINNLKVKGPAKKICVFNAYGTKEDIFNPELVVGKDENGNDIKNPNPMVKTKEIVVSDCGELEIVASTEDSILNTIPVVKK